MNKNSGDRSDLELQSAGKKDLRPVYEAVAERWAHDGPSTHGDLIAGPVVLEWVQRLAPGGLVVDLGCGDGFYARLISQHVRRVIGVDYAANMLREAVRRQNKCSNISYVRCNMLDVSECLDVGERVDLCLAINATCCVQTTHELEAVYSQVVRLLKPGGGLIVQIPHPLDGEFREESEWLRDLDRLKSYFEAGQCIRRSLRTVSGEWLPVARYHFSVSQHFEAMSTQGLVVRHLFEPAPTEALLAAYPSLARDARLPSTLIFIVEKPADVSAQRR